MIHFTSDTSDIFEMIKSLAHFYISDLFNAGSLLRMEFFVRQYCFVKY